MAWTITSNGNGAINGRVSVYADLPDATISTDQVWIVEEASGVPFINRKEAGLYYSNGVTWGYMPNSVQASFVQYNNSASQLDALNAQTAIDELDAYSDNIQTVTDGMGVQSGMALSADTTTFNISAGIYNDLEAKYPQIYPGATLVTLDNLLTHLATYIAINPDGNVIIQKTSPFTPEERRLYVILGAIIHTNKTTVNAVNNLPDVAVSGLAQQMDLMDALSGFNKEGNLISANGANLFLNKSIGCVFKKGVGFQTTPTAPNEIELPALVAPSNLRHRLSTGTEYLNTQSLLLSWEDTVGTSAPIPNSSYTTHRVFLFTSNLIRIQLGQTLYNTMASAQQNIFSEIFTKEQNLDENGLLRGYIIVRGGTTDLSDTARALFIEADRFGQLPVGGSGGTTTLQQAYSNSATPEITTDATLGALSVKRGSASDYDKVLEVQKGDGTVTASFDGEGSLQNTYSLVFLSNKESTLLLIITTLQE